MQQGLVLVASALALALVSPSLRAQSAAAPVVEPPQAPERKSSLEPKRAEGPIERVTFRADPIADGAIILVALGSAGVLELISSTGEIRPQQIAPNFDRSQLIAIDRAAVTSNPSASATRWSNAGLGIAALFAVVDPLLSGMREQSVQAGLVDAIMYAETAAITITLTDIVKMAVRRPRPLAYTEAEAHKNDPDWSNADTDSALSFFSTHAALTSAIGATATYLAFSRSKGKLRPWLTLALAAGMTTFVSVERVRAGKHFPTDVLAGAFAGAGIGVLVPHLHRTEDVLQRRVWVGFAPEMREQTPVGGAFTLTGVF